MHGDRKLTRAKQKVDGKQTHKMKLEMNSKPRGEGIPSRSETKPTREANPWGGGMGMDINWAGIKSII